MIETFNCVVWDGETQKRAFLGHRLVGEVRERFLSCILFLCDGSDPEQGFFKKFRGPGRDKYVADAKKFLENSSMFGRDMMFGMMNSLVGDLNDGVLQEGIKDPTTNAALVHVPQIAVIIPMLYFIRSYEDRNGIHSTFSSVVRMYANGGSLTLTCETSVQTIGTITTDFFNTSRQAEIDIAYECDRIYSCFRNNLNKYLDLHTWTPDNG